MKRSVAATQVDGHQKKATGRQPVPRVRPKYDEEPLKPISSLESFYDRHCIEINFLISALKALLSEFLVQSAARFHCKDHCKYRMLPFASAVAISIFYVSPVLTLFFGYLGSLQVDKWKKVVIDQFLFAPLYTSGVLALKLFTNTQLPVQNIPLAVIGKLPTAMGYGWLFWIPAKVFLLYAVAPKYHLLSSHIISLMWNIILNVIV